jgi:hypothetical protein
MADIFISFVHEDAAVASAVQQFVRESYESQKVFLSADEWQVFAGDDWLQRIREELEPAKIVLLLLSERSVSRPWVNFEAGGAWLTGKKIIPVCVGKLDKGGLPKPYSSWQALHLPEDAYFLLTSLGHHLHLISPPPGFIEEKSTALKSLTHVLDRAFPAA